MIVNIPKDKGKVMLPTISSSHNLRAKIMISTLMDLYVDIWPVVTHIKMRRGLNTYQRVSLCALLALIIALTIMVVKI